MTDYTTYTGALEGSSPAGGKTIGGADTSKPTLSDWYPDRLRVEQLHRDGAAANPLAGFDYPAAFATINLDELRVVRAGVLSMYSGPQYVASSASHASRRPPPKP